MSNYYKPSGKFELSSFIHFIILSLSIFPILGLIYAYAIWYIPFIYINFLIAAGLGFGIGLSINLIVVKYGKVRNIGLTLLFGILGGVITMYFHWAVWVDLVINAGESYGNSRLGFTVSNISFLQVFSLALDPGTLVEIIAEIYEFGTWGFGSSSVSGVFLGIIWLIEFVIIVGIALVIPLGAAGEPFCEVGNQWFEEKIMPSFTFINDESSLVDSLGKGNIETIKELSQSSDKDSHSVFTLYTSGFDENYLSIENKTAKIDKDGKLDFDSNTVVQHISISKEIKESILAL